MAGLRVTLSTSAAGAMTLGVPPPLAEIFPYNYIVIPCDCQAVSPRSILIDNDSHY